MKGKILIAAAAALVLFSCTEKEMESPADTLEVTPATLDFGWKNNEPKTLTVKTNVEDWDFSADGWIEATVEGGNLVVNVTDNEEYEERTGKILVTAGNAKPVRVEVTQDARVHSSLELSQEEFVAKPEGDTFEITVTSAEEWTVSGSSEWCRLSPEEGVSGDKITLTVDPNDTEEARNAQFSIISGTVIKVVKVTSEPVPFLEITSPTEEQSFDYNGGDFNISLRTNVPVDGIKYKIEGNDGGWVSVTPSEKTWSVHVSANNTYLARQATISFSAEGVEPVSVTLTEAKRPYLKLLDPKSGSLELTTEAQQVSVSVITNLPVTYNGASWITQVGEAQVINETADGLTTYKFTFDITKSEGSRQGAISILYEQSVVAVTVKQIAEETVYATIPDATFREFLTDNEYIIPDGDNARVEVTAAGQAATSFDFSWGYTSIASIEGIEAFTNLTSINLSNCQAITKVDISGLKNVTSLTLGYCGYIEEVNLGDNNITMLSYGLETTVYPETVKISSVKLLYLAMSYQSFTMPDTWRYLDVTECPSLYQIDSERPSPVTIYCTKSQSLSVINEGNGVLTVRE